MFKGKELLVRTGTGQHGTPVVTVSGSWCDPHTPCGARTPLAHHMAGCRHLQLMQSCTQVPCTWIMVCIALCTCPPWLRCPAQPAWHPSHALHVALCTRIASPAQTPALCCHPLQHYPHIPAYATRVPSASLLQRPLRSSEHTVACLAAGILVQLSPCTTGSRCCVLVLALPWLHPAPGASPGLLVCSRAAGSPGPHLQAACQVTRLQCTLLCALHSGMLSLGYTLLCSCVLSHATSNCRPEITVARSDPHPVVLSGCRPQGFACSLCALPRVCKDPQHQ